MGNKEVGTTNGFKQIVVGIPKMRHDKFPNHHFASLAVVHDPLHQGGSGFLVRHIGSDCMKLDSGFFHLFLVEKACRNDRLMSSVLEGQSDGKVGVQIAQGTERGENDSHDVQSSSGRVFDNCYRQLRAIR